MIDTSINVLTGQVYPIVGICYAERYDDAQVVWVVDEGGLQRRSMGKVYSRAELGKNWYGYQVKRKKTVLEYLRNNRQEAKEKGQHLPAELQQEEAISA